MDPGIVNQDGYNAIHIAAMTNSSSALRVILTDSIISNRNWLIGSVFRFHRSRINFAGLFLEITPNGSVGRHGGVGK